MTKEHEGTLGDDRSVHCLDHGVYIAQSFSLRTQCMWFTECWLYLTVTKPSNKKPYPQPRFLLANLVVWGVTKIIHSSGRIHSILLAL